MKNAKEKECSFSSPREQREREILDGFLCFGRTQRIYCFRKSFIYRYIYGTKKASRLTG